MRNINIAFAVNDDYVQHLNVTMHSVLKNNPGQKFTFFILCESLTDDSKDLISVLSEIYKNVETRIIELKSKGYGFDKFVIPESVNFITKEMYFRYALPEILPDIDKVLYLDADLIVLGSIDVLYDENIEQYYLAGAVDAGLSLRFPDHLAGIGMSSSDIYINSGVLLMNLDKMRKDSIFDKLLANTKKYEKQLRFPDQDAINLTLKGFIKPIQPIYNFTDQDMLEDKIGIDKVNIVHFTGEIKPWHDIPRPHTKKYAEKYGSYEDEYYRLAMEKKSLTISIIIPVYNIPKKHLVECFESIKGQTHKNTEIIIVDDGSSKETADFLDQYTKDLDNWLVIHQKNTGVNMARKAGFDTSTGDLVTFVDSDDVLASTFCERLYKTVLKTSADMVIAERRDFSDDIPLEFNDNSKQSDDVLTGKENIIRSHRIVPFGMYIWSMAVWGGLYKRELIKKIDWELSNYTIAEDEFWSMQSKIFSEKIAYVHERLYGYRESNSSRSKVIKPIRFNGREIPHIALGLEMFHRNTELFKKHKISLLDEPLLYGIKTTKELILKISVANKLDKKNQQVAVDVAKDFLTAINESKAEVNESDMLSLTLISCDPLLFVGHAKTREEDRQKIDMLRHEIALRDRDLELLRQPGIKLASQKLAGSVKRRLKRAFGLK